MADAVLELEDMLVDVRWVGLAVLEGLEGVVVFVVFVDTVDAVGRACGGWEIEDR